MHSTHLQLRTPDDPGQHIWRYMSFAKFVALLDEGGLYFSYVRSFKDTLEGHPEKRKRRRAGSGDKDDFRAFVSSWHLNEHESEAMWRLYSPVEEAIAVQTTYSRLRSQLAPEFRIFEVRYVDQLPSGPADRPPFYPFFFKRRAFEHEKELRAVFLESVGAANGPRSGRIFPVDVEELVERVFVSPLASEWFIALVRRVAQKYGLQREVCPSTLYGTLEG